MQMKHKIHIYSGRKSENSVHIQMLASKPSRNHYRKQRKRRLWNQTAETVEECGHRQINDISITTINGRIAENAIASTSANLQQRSNSRSKNDPQKRISSETEQQQEQQGRHTLPLLQYSSADAHKDREDAKRRRHPYYDRIKNFSGKHQHGGHQLDGSQQGRRRRENTTANLSLKNNNHNSYSLLGLLLFYILFPLVIIMNFIHFGAEGTLMSNEHQQQQQQQQQQQSIQWEENPPEAYRSDEEMPSHFGVNTTYISQILNRLTDKVKYDKRLRPRYGEGAVDVGISIHITSISAVSEVDMDFTLDFYLRQTWYDQRLAFAQIDPELARRIKKLTVGVDYLDRLWKPDTFFPNEKTSMFHVATTPNTFLRIEPDGRIYTSQRMTVKAMCPMALAMFPMDSQTCKLGLESYGYDVDDIDYYWGERRSDGKKPEDAVAFDDFFLPQFRRTGYRVTGTHVRTASGEYARLYIEVILTRNLGFYLMNIIIPSMLIVSISWVSFWLSREASPARVGLGVTTVLTMTTLITTTNNSMPKVSYIKGLDVFLNFCFVMVFASLVEYAVVSYWNKRQCRRRDRRERIRSAPALTSAGGGGGVQHSDSGTFNTGQIMAPSGTEYPMFMNFPTTPAGGLAVPSPNSQSYVYRAPGLLVATPTVAGIQPSQQSASGASGLNQQQQPVVVGQQQQQQQGQGSSNQQTAHAVPMPPDCDCRLGNIPLFQYTTEYQQQQLQHQHHHPQLGLSNSMPYMMAATPTAGGKLNRRHRRPYSYYGGMGMTNFGMNSGRRGLCRTILTCRRLNPSKIDRLSRCGFPMLFIIFNLVYWSALTFMSQRELEKVDFVAFN